MVYKILHLFHFWICSKFRLNKIKTGLWPQVGKGTNLFFPDFGFFGDYFYMGRYGTIETNVKIGNNVIIGNFCALVGKNDHQYNIPGLLMRHSNKARNKKISTNKDFIHISDDVWIGHGSIVLSGVNISKGCIIAAGSVVIKDTSPYGIYAGIPARRLKDRFNKKQISIHEKNIY